MSASRLFLSFLLTLLASAALPLAAQTRGTRINLDFPELAAKASETVDVTLDGPMLRLASRFLSSTDADERSAKEMISRLSGIYVRSYEFDHEGEYDKSLAGRIRSQLGPSWQKIVKVTSKTKEDVDIYADMHGEAITGLLIISAEPKEFTVVNIIGPVDLEKLTGLEGQFGIPHITRNLKDKGAKDKATDKAAKEKHEKEEDHD